MSTIELKKLLVKRIRSTDNVEILNALRVLTDDKIQPVSGAIRKKLQKSLKDLNTGRVQSNNEVLDELEKWLAAK